MKQTIRLNESQFKKLITETVKKVLREENGFPTDYDVNNDDEQAFDPEFESLSSREKQEQKNSDFSNMISELRSYIESETNIKILKSMLDNAICNYIPNLGYNKFHDFWTDEGGIQYRMRQSNKK